MTLSRDEKALAEAAYSRLQFWRKGYGAWAKLIVFVLVIDSGNFFVKELHHPGISMHKTIILAGIMGAVISACIFSAFFLTSQRKRDGQLVRFFEERFPDECSWKQEEWILAEAEDIRLRASADLARHKTAC
jgi:hypothetical protein